VSEPVLAQLLLLALQAAHQMPLCVPSCQLSSSRNLFRTLCQVRIAVRMSFRSCLRMLNLSARSFLLSFLIVRSSRQHMIVCRAAGSSAGAAVPFPQLFSTRSGELFDILAGKALGGQSCQRMSTLPIGPPTCSKLEINQPSTVNHFNLSHI
jgi:hypothetical protein